MKRLKRSERSTERFPFLTVASISAVTCPSLPRAGGLARRMPVTGRDLDAMVPSPRGKAEVLPTS